jgi:hypothetical protein
MFYKVKADAKAIEVAQETPVREAPNSWQKRWRDHGIPQCAAPRDISACHSLTICLKFPTVAIFGEILTVG